jgi:hypothetical protein
VDPPLISFCAFNYSCFFDFTASGISYFLYYDFGGSDTRANSHIFCAIFAVCLTLWGFILGLNL